MAGSRKTGPKAAHFAGKLLQSSPSKPVKIVAASDLSQAAPKTKTNASRAKSAKKK